MLTISGLDRWPSGLPRCHSLIEVLHSVKLQHQWAHFLRDQQITNVTVSEDAIRQISGALQARKATMNVGVPQDNASVNRALLTYVIRFDNKGYRVFSLDDLLRYFHLAKAVERVVFTLETGESLRNNRLVGASSGSGLMREDPNLCLLTVTSNDSDWVDACFSGIHDVLVKCKNKNGWVKATRGRNSPCR